MNAAQLRAIFWLRWRLTRNQWKRGGTLQYVITMILIIGGLVGSVSGFFGGVLLGKEVFHRVPAWGLMLIWDGLILVFLLFWVIGLLVQIQRSESIEIPKLLHLPVHVKQVFFLNFLISLLSPITVLLLPAMIGIILGMALRLGWPMLLLLPLLIVFVFMISTWTYCLRGWLMAQMADKRRRRKIIVGLTIFAVAMGQLPNLAINNPYSRNWIKAQEKRAKAVQVESTPAASEAQATPRRQSPLPEWVFIVHSCVPLTWTSRGAWDLSHGRFNSTGTGILGGLLLGLWGLQRAYVVSFRFYRGHSRKPVRRKERAPADPRAETAFMEKNFPGLTPETSGLTLAFLRTIQRAPEIKLLMIMPVAMLLVFGSMHFTRNLTASGTAGHLLLVAGAVSFTMLGMIQLAANQFGMDREGFRALVLLPVPRRRILLAKNLALLPVTGLMGGVFLVFLKLVMGISWLLFFTGLMQVLTASFLTFLVGNLISIMVPFRIAPGSLKPTKVRAGTMVMSLLLNLMFPVLLLPVLLPSLLEYFFQRIYASLAWVPVNLMGSALVLAVTLPVYAKLLHPLGDFLQSREQRILRIVTEEVE